MHATFCILLDLAGLTLINQTVSALVYNAPGRQTLTCVGVWIETDFHTSGPAIQAQETISMVDSVIVRHGPVAPDTGSGGTMSTAIASSGRVFLYNTYVSNFAIAVQFADGTPSVPGTTTSGTWAHLDLVAKGVAVKTILAPIFVNATRQTNALVSLWKQLGAHLCSAEVSMSAFF